MFISWSQTLEKWFRPVHVEVYKTWSYFQVQKVAIFKATRHPHLGTRNRLSHRPRRWIWGPRMIMTNPGSWRQIREAAWRLRTEAMLRLCRFLLKTIYRSRQFYISRILPMIWGQKMITINRGTWRPSSPKLLLTAVPQPVITLEWKPVPEVIKTSSNPSQSYLRLM